MPPTKRLLCVGDLRLRQDALCTLSFLYKTRTIQRGGRRCEPHKYIFQGSSQQCRRLTTSGRRPQEQRYVSSSRYSSRPPSNRRYPPQRREPTIDYASQADVLPSFNINSTLTPLENQKFRRIFEAAARGLPPPSQQQETDVEDESKYRIGVSLDKKFEGLVQHPAMPGEDTNAAATVSEGAVDLTTATAESELASDATSMTAEHEGLDEKKKVEARELQRLQRAERAEKRRASSMHFPEALRVAWRDVQRSTSQVSSAAKKAQKKKKKSSGYPNPVSLGGSEVSDILNFFESCKAARSDHEIWSLLESRVFSRIPKLVYTIELFKQKKSMAKKKKDVTKSKTSTIDVDSNESSAAAPTETAVDLGRKLSLKEMSVVQCTYSSHLINAVRVLRSRHPRSPFIVALLPTVKKLSPISQVLGANTALYNELLYTAWRQGSDIAECARLVEDMYAQGLEADEYTLAVFADAQTEMNAALADRQFVRPSRRLWWRLQGVQSSMTRWHAAMDLLSIRAEDEERAEEEWEMLGDGSDASTLKV